MLKVWRGSNTILAECTDCGSYGTAPHLKPTIKLDPEIADAVERHTARMMALRSHYTAAADVLVRQVRDGSLSRNDATAKIRVMYENHVAQIRLGEASLPNPEGKLTELATACPWCGSPEEVEIETLPDDQAEPEFALAVPVREYLAAQLQENAATQQGATNGKIERVISKNTNKGS